MIIYYQKSDGKITGHTDGRNHSDEHLKSYIGEPDKIDRIIVNWIPAKYYTKEGYELPKDCLDACDENGYLLLYTTDFKPSKQIKIFTDLENKPFNVYEYKVDLKTKKLVKIV
jgi:hypothetical protein